ncbi:FAD-dependent monooxygenase [Amycolatopsis minnesotensis]|uniref:NAD(P)/FAD-dependent oxidoreductase n=1 Tax=Amycolatopsis minnesotensis TaxID=337894 RepID=A0ABP5BB32_9PSEU
MSGRAPVSEVDVVILGAGVSGSLLALLLGRQGLRVTVAEAKPAIATKGADFLKPRGLRILAEHGLLDVLTARGALRRTTIDFHHDGLPLLSYEFAEHTELGYYLVVPYAETVRAILEACAELPGVDIRYDTALVDVRAEGPTVTGARLSDGTLLTARAFVDASGSGTPLRDLVGPRRHAITYDHGLWMTTVPGTKARGQLYFGSDGWLAYFYSVTADLTRVFVGVPTELEEAVFLRRSVDLRGKLASFVTDEDGIAALDVGDFERVPVSAFTADPYHRGNVALLGGSTFACHPMTGQGMSYSMEDATVLAALLAGARDGNELEHLLEQQYEPRRLVHARLVEYGDNLARRYHDKDAYLRVHDAVLHGGDL